MRSSKKSAERNEDLGTPGPTMPQSPTASGNERLRKGDVLAVLARQNVRCALTGRALEPTCATLDHVIPLIKGGKHIASNIQILHSRVNLAKGSMTQDEFVALCREVVAHADSHEQGA